MRRSDSMPRRRFVKLALAGVAAVAAAPLARAAEAAARVRTPPRDVRRITPAALRREIENQTRTVASIAKTIRDYPLPAGSPPAPVFRAMRRRGR